MSRLSWRRSDEQRHSLLKGNIVVMTVEQLPGGSWYFYGMRFNSAAHGKRYATLDDCKKAAEQQVALLSRKD